MSEVRKEIKDLVTQCKYCLQVVPTAPEQRVIAVQAVVQVERRPISFDDRKMILLRAISRRSFRTMRIERQSDSQAVLRFGQRPNDILHFLIGVFTIGLWWIRRATRGRRVPDGSHRA